MVEMTPAEGGLFGMGFAGDTFNTAWYVRRLAGRRMEVIYLTAIGSDAISARMAAFMQDAGITTRLDARDDSTVGLYLVSLEDGERSFSYWRANSAARHLHEALSKVPSLGEGDIVYFSGISMAILPPVGRQALVDKISKVRRGGARVAFDPNLRPLLWSDAAEMRRWITVAAQVSDIVLPSFDDERDGFGDRDPQATAERYAAAGANTVAVKNGARDAFLRQGDQTIKISPDPVDFVVDTTAAGDSFNAAFLTSLAAGMNAPDAMRAGCRLSAKVIGQRGALVDV